MAKRRHGMTRLENGRRNPTYTAWLQMRDRCDNPTNKSWADYGGRGIKVCERWMTFEAFFADLGARPAGLTLERSNNELGYEPGNVRWATRTEQNRNTRRTKLTLELVNEIRGRFEHGEGSPSISVRLGLNRSTIHTVLINRIWCEDGPIKLLGRRSKRSAASGRFIQC